MAKTIREAERAVEEIEQQLQNTRKKIADETRERDKVAGKIQSLAAEEAKLNADQVKANMGLEEARREEEQRLAEN